MGTQLIQQLTAERDRLRAIVTQIDATITAMHSIATAVPTTSVEPKPTKSVPPTRVNSKSEPRRTQTSLSKTEVTTAEAADRLGGNVHTVYQLKYTGILKGSRGHVDVASLQAYLTIRKKPGGPKRAAPVAKEKKSLAVAAPPANDAAWDAGSVVGQTYKKLPWIAKQLEMDEDQVREIIHNGGIHGNETVANWDQLRAYMKHPEYNAPQPVEA